MSNDTRRVVCTAMTSAESYRQRAAELRTRAAHESDAQRAREWSHLARCYLRLAEQAEQNRVADLWAEFGPKVRLDREGA